MRLVWLGVESSYSHSSLALPLLSNACRDVSGWEWELVSGTIRDDAFELCRRVVSLEPDVVSSTAYLFNRHVVLDVLGRIKRLRPDVVIIVGGPECLGEGADSLLSSSSFIDYVVRGEGESVLPLFLERLSSGEDMGGIPGLLYRGGENSGSGFDTGWAEAPLPGSDRFFDFEKPFAQIETSRGCPMGCTYCTSCRTPVRMKSLDRVREELTCLRDGGVREIRVLDRTFNVPDSRGAELLRLFRQEFGDMRFHLEIHPGVLGSEVRHELRLANKGNLHIEAGVQTFNPDVLALVGRSTDVDAVQEGLRFLTGTETFETHCDLLAGLPGQTLEDVIVDVEQLVELGAGEIQLESLKVLPGTELRRQADELGLIFSDEPLYDVMATKTMNQDDMATCRHLSRILDLFHNPESLRQTFRAAYGEVPGFVRDFLGWCKESDIGNIGNPLSLRRRFELLEEFFVDRGYVLGLDELTKAWMANAFPTCSGCGLRAKLAPSLPEGFECISGDPSVMSLQGTRLWEVSLSSGLLFVAYNRGIAPNRAVAMFTKIGTTNGHE